MLWIQTPGEKRVAAAPVTNLQWKRFLDESGYVPGEEDHDGDYLKHWVDGKPLEDQLNRPVVYISYINAWAFCDFYGYRLPTEQELRTLDGHGVWEWYGDRHPVSCRGGSFGIIAWLTRCAYRSYGSPRFCYCVIGFRPAQDIKSEGKMVPPPNPPRYDEEFYRFRDQLDGRITVPRELFECLTEYAEELLAEWQWMKGCKAEARDMDYARLLEIWEQAREIIRNEETHE